jgi:transcription elongation factor
MPTWEREEMIKLMRRKEEEYRKKEEELKLEREKERMRFERERLEREKLEVKQMKLTAQLANAQLAFMQGQAGGGAVVGMPMGSGMLGGGSTGAAGSSSIAMGMMGESGGRESSRHGSRSKEEGKGQKYSSSSYQTGNKYELWKRIKGNLINLPQHFQKKSVIDSPSSSRDRYTKMYFNNNSQQNTTTKNDFHASPQQFRQPQQYQQKTF